MDKVFETKGIKKTKQREIIYNIIINADEETTIKSIYSKCNRYMDKATVYRIIELFTNENIITVSVDKNGNKFYSLINSNHSHSLLCTNCQKEQKVDYCIFGNIKELIEKESGFKITNHIIELKGLCNECQKKV